MSLQGKRINKKQAAILDQIFDYFDVMHSDLLEHGEGSVDMTETRHAITELTEELYIAFGKADKKILEA